MFILQLITIMLFIYMTIKIITACFTCPPLDLMHAANHAIKCCHCMWPSFFLIQMVVSSMAPTHKCLASGLWLTHCWINATPEKKSNCLSWETEWAKLPLSLSLPSSLYTFCSEISVLLSWNVEALHNVATVIFMLQEVHCLNEVAIHFPGNSCRMEQLKIPQ
jgi:hypothetical protein